MSPFELQLAIQKFIDRTDQSTDVRRIMENATIYRHKMLDTEAAARYCGVGKSTLEKLRLTGGGPRYLKPTRKVVYQVSDLDAWLDQKRHMSTSEYRHDT